MFSRFQTTIKTVVFVLVTFILILSSFSCITVKLPSGQGGTSPAVTTGAITAPHLPSRTGTIFLGEKVDLGSQSIGVGGGGISISKPGDPLDGFSIGVPEKSFPGNSTFKVSYAPIKGETFGDDFTPASPLITVDNGGGYSDQFMYVTVPVNIPAGYFAMGFLYDETTKQLEGMPLITQDATSITVATRHFSSFLIGMIERLQLKEDADSKFRPGVDDWQFVNNGSNVARGGHCEGQSLAAMWYYCTQPDGKDVRLYGRYDNNGEKPASPKFDLDDSYGYRLCSMVQIDGEATHPGNATSFAYQSWASLAGRYWQTVNNQGGRWTNVPAIISDASTRDLFAFSIQMTNEPQLIKVHDDSIYGGHSMICYRVTKDTLFIADPNYPGDTGRKVELANGKFSPYQSGADRQAIEAGKSTAYNHIMYYAKSTVIRWDQIPQRWSEVKNGTIGNDKFPGYKLVRKDEKGAYVPLTSGYISKDKGIVISALPIVENGAVGGSVYRDGVMIPISRVTYDWELYPGENKLGIYIHDWADKYIDFKYVTIIYEEEKKQTTTPASKPTTTTPAVTGTGWVLDGQPVINKDKDTDLPPCYTGRKISVSNGTGSGTVNYSPDCFKQGSGTYTGNINWTPPPSSLAPGNKITLTMTATKSGGDASQASGLIKVDNKTIIESYDTGQKTGTGVFEVPKGSPGSKLEIYVSFVACGLHGYVTYNYIYK